MNTNKLVILSISAIFVGLLFFGWQVGEASAESFTFDSIPLIAKKTPASAESISGMSNIINAATDIILNSDHPLAEKIQLSEVRKQEVLKLMKEDPLAFLAIKISDDNKNKLSANIQSNIEQAVNVQGTIETLVLNKRNSSTSTFQVLYYLNTGGERLQFFPAGNPAWFKSGTTVNISGFRLGDELVAFADKSIIGVTSQPVFEDTTGNQRTLIILVDHPGYPAPPFTKEQINNMFFNGQFKNFFKEMSYDKISFSGDVYDWYSCDTEDWNCLTHILQFYHIDPSQYGRLLVIDNPPTDAGNVITLSTQGKFDTFFYPYGHYRQSYAYIEANRSYYIQPSGFAPLPFSWTNFDYWMSYLINTNLGIVFPNGWDCGNQSLYGNCQIIRNANYFNLGSRPLPYPTNYALHNDAYYKKKLNWINSRDEVLITKNGNYSIGIFESATTSKKIAMIQMPNSGQIPFYLEYRKGIGFDSGLNNKDYDSNQNGLLINKARNNFWGQDSELIDASPTSETWANDVRSASLNASSTLADSERGITISNVITSSSTINFKVNFSPTTCNRNSPTISFLKAGEDAIQTGQSSYIYMEVINNDSNGCPASIFKVDRDMPRGWENANTIARSSPVYPGDSYLSLITFTPPFTEQPGEYLLNLKIINTSSNMSVTRVVPISVFQSPLIYSFDHTSGLPGETIKANGIRFSLLDSPHVYITGAQSSNHSLSYVGIARAGSDTKASFDFPFLMNVYGCDDCVVPPPPGEYLIQIFQPYGLFTNPINFTINNRDFPIINIKKGNAASATTTTTTTTTTATATAVEPVNVGDIMNDNTDSVGEITDLNHQR